MPISNEHSLRSSRDEVARHVADAFRGGGAMRTDLLRAAMNSWAPQPVIETLLTLPDGHFRSLDELWRWLPDLPER